MSLCQPFPGPHCVQDKTEGQRENEAWPLPSRHSYPKLTVQEGREIPHSTQWAHDHVLTGSQLHVEVPRGTGALAWQSLLLGGVGFGQSVDGEDWRLIGPEEPGGNPGLEGDFFQAAGGGGAEGTGPRPQPLSLPFPPRPPSSSP